MSIAPHRKPCSKERVPIEYHGGRKDLPIFVRQKKHLSTTEIVETLLDPDLDGNEICKAQPVAVESNLAFIVDLKNLNHPKDLLCDELGSWKCNGCRHTWVVVSDIGVAEICGKNKPDNVDGSLYKVTKKYYLNKGSPDFHRMVVTMEGMVVCDVFVLYAGRMDRMLQQHIMLLVTWFLHFFGLHVHTVVVVLSYSCYNVQCTMYNVYAEGGGGKR